MTFAKSAVELYQYRSASFRRETAGFLKQLLPLVIATLCGNLSHIRAQTLAPLPSHSQQSFAGAENRWQLQESDASSKADWISPELREKRSAYWRSELPSHVVPNMTTIQTEPLLPDIEFPYISGGAYLVATFVDYRVIPVDPSERYIYTERHLRVDDVIFQPSSSDLQPGEFIDSAIQGGTIRKKSGERYSFLVSPKRFALQPGQQYIVLVHKNMASLTYDVVKAWLLRDGIVVPDDNQEVIRVASNSSKIAGRPLSFAAHEISQAAAEQASRVILAKKKVKDN